MWTEANGIWILTQFGLDTFLEHDKTDKSFSFSTTNLIIRFIFDKPFRESWKKWQNSSILQSFCIGNLTKESCKEAATSIFGIF